MIGSERPEAVEIASTKKHEALHHEFICVTHEYSWFCPKSQLQSYAVNNLVKLTNCSCEEMIVNPL